MNYSSRSSAVKFPRVQIPLSTAMVEITIRKRPRTDAVATQRKFFKKTARGKVVKGACTFSRNFIQFKLTILQSSASGICATMWHAGSRAARHATRRLGPASPRWESQVTDCIQLAISCCLTRMSFCTRWMSSSPACLHPRSSFCRRCSRRSGIVRCRCIVALAQKPTNGSSPVTLHEFQMPTRI